MRPAAARELIAEGPRGTESRGKPALRSADRAEEGSGRYPDGVPLPGRPDSEEQDHG